MNHSKIDCNSIGVISDTPYPQNTALLEKTAKTLGRFLQLIPQKRKIGQVLGATANALMKTKHLALSTIMAPLLLPQSRYNKLT